MIASTDKQLRKRDLLIAVLLCLPIFILCLTVGDTLFIGWIYYLLVLALPILLSLPSKPSTYFLSGISLSANVGLWFFWFWCYFTLKNGSNNGLLGIYHIFVFLPAWVLGWLVLLYFHRKKDFSLLNNLFRLKNLSPLKHFFLAFVLTSFMPFIFVGCLFF